MTKKQIAKSPRILQIRKDRDYDCVYVKGKKIMLGKSGTPEAQAAFLELQRQVFIDPTLSSATTQQVTVDNVCLAYLELRQRV